MLTAEVRTGDYYFEKLQEVWIRIFYVKFVLNT